MPKTIVKPAEGQVNEERLRLMLESVPDYAIFMLDRGGRIASWNLGAMRLKGYTANEIIGQHFSIFYPAEAKAARKPQRELETAIKVGRYEEEGWRVRKDGSLFWASVVITPIRDEKGRHVGFAKVTRDLTERRRADESLRRTNRELEQYASFVSHDLQEPLRKMASFAELLARRYRGKLGPEADQYIGYIVDGAQRMRGLITDVLAFSRLSREAPPHEGQVDLNAVLAVVRGDLELRLSEAKAKLLVARLPTVRGDAGLLGRLFQNLIGNAVKFRQPKRSLRVAVMAGRRGKDWVISVRDNGIGFKAAEAARIFDPFKRLHRKEEYPGSGLGLAVCKKIAQMHGGTIVAQGRPGKGSTFRVTLPAAP
jgi:PAS domain S-box-containing protein